MRQFAINKEFELGIESSSPIKYRDFCKGGDSPWRIHAREEIKGSPTIIVRVNCGMTPKKKKIG
jgi:hypothetical protein